MPAPLHWYAASVATTAEALADALKSPPGASQGWSGNSAELQVASPGAAAVPRMPVAPSAPPAARPRRGWWPTWSAPPAKWVTKERTCTSGGLDPACSATIIDCQTNPDASGPPRLIWWRQEGTDQWYGPTQTCLPGYPPPPDVNDPTIPRTSAPPPPVPTIGQIREAFMALPFAKPEVSMQPVGNKTLVNLPTYYQAAWPEGAGLKPGDLMFYDGDRNGTGPVPEIDRGTAEELRRSVLCLRRRDAEMREQQGGIHRQRREKAAAEEFGLSQPRREEQRIHSGRDVANGGIAEERRRDQHPEQAAEQHEVTAPRLRCGRRRT